MTTQIQRRRGTTAQHSTFTGANGEVTVDTDKEVLVVHDGAQAGGYPQMRENGSNSALALGSAATPSLKFTGDTNTGIYSPGADQVAISTNGMGRLFVNSAGKVLIGYTSDQFSGNLQVSGTARIGSFDFGNAANELIYTSGADMGVGTFYGNSLYFKTNNTERMRLDASGRLGLGTSSPGYKLDVNGEVAFSPNTAGKNTFYFTTNASNDASLFLKSDTTNKVNIQANGSSYFNGGNVGIGTSSPSESIHTTGKLRVGDGGNYTVAAVQLGASNANGISYPGTNILNFITNSTAALTIDASQRVGIGTTAPLSGLDVSGSFITVSKGASTTGRIGASDYIVGDTSNDFVVQSSGTGVTRFFQTSSEKARIDSSGRLGLGTSSPGAGIHIATAGQTTSALDTAGNINLLVTDTGASAGNGGSVVFGFNSGGGRFASIKGQVITGAGNSTGHLTFSTRNATSDAALTERLRITYDGFVGIGTTSPSAATHVVQPSSGSDTFRAENSASNNVIRLQAATSTDNYIDFYAGASSGSLILRGAGTERARLTADGKWLVGTSSARSNIDGGNAPQVQIEGAGYPAATMSLTRNSADTGAPIFYFAKTRSASVGGNTAVQSGDTVGQLIWTGSDGTNTIKAAEIKAEIDGTPGANDMPGRLVFSTTADGASSPTERMRIGADGYNRVFAANSVYVAMTAQGAGTTYSLIDGNHSATSVGSGNGTNSFRVWSNGNVQNTNNSYTALSDVKLKENIVDANSQWDDLKALQVRNYNLKEGQNHRQIGLVAQEVEPISPGLVYESPDRDAEGNDLGTVTKSVNYSVLYMKAVKALQEAMERIETLEAKVTALEAV
jgi:hypothetical protein